jgi:hypothetical protein
MRMKSKSIITIRYFATDPVCEAKAFQAWETGTAECCHTARFGREEIRRVEVSVDIAGDDTADFG